MTEILTLDAAGRLLGRAKGGVAQAMAMMRSNLDQFYPALHALQCAALGLTRKPRREELSPEEYPDE